jgi:hypothetical protein
MTYKIPFEFSNIYSLQITSRRSTEHLSIFTLVAQLRFLVRQHGKRVYVIYRSAKLGGMPTDNRNSPLLRYDEKTSAYIPIYVIQCKITYMRHTKLAYTFFLVVLVYIQMQH